MRGKRGDSGEWIADLGESGELLRWLCGARAAGQRDMLGDIPQSSPDSRSRSFQLPAGSGGWSSPNRLGGDGGSGMARSG